MWVRLWLDMPTDPKFRVIAKRAERPLSEVIALFAYMLTVAGKHRTQEERTQANASERGELFGWQDDDAAAALDIETAHVAAIREAMQGKVLDGLRLAGWEKRQPKREDGSAERAKRWRERKRTQANAPERLDTDTDIKDSCSKNSAPTRPSAPESEQSLEFRFAKGGGGERAYRETRKRAEGFGLPVEDLEAATRRARPRDPAAYLRALCVNRLQPQLPDVRKELLLEAMQGRPQAYTLVCAAMMGAAQ